MDLKKYLTVRQVAEKLDITEEWVRDLIKAREIKALKIGKWRIRDEDLEAFVETRTNG
ncbi:MAG: helix-turn-helix domain-containing protein [Candidatus Omnitrophica bacterium]|nr:helix-turn-helix domain-containing protein [Candidatus Omnitrophota bacterium]MCK5082564.1 helix-turn-helix domain-containing protein [Candidatus Omnitrophota bacterium]MCK5178752.1 helix-turn-helix domain-containing protein [Candidatus Omnitrophota bacterium]